MKEISRSTLLSLADARLREAQVLLAADLSSGAYYLAGYALELRLKALVSGRFSAGVIPDPKMVASVFTHNLTTLVSLAGLSEAHGDALRRNPKFGANWSVVREWNEHSRYTIKDAAAATALLAAIEEPQNGVMAWLDQHS